MKEKLKQLGVNGVMYIIQAMMLTVLVWAGSTLNRLDRDNAVKGNTIMLIQEDVRETRNEVRENKDLVMSSKESLIRLEQIVTDTKEDLDKHIIQTR